MPSNLESDKTIDCILLGLAFTFVKIRFPLYVVHEKNLSKIIYLIPKFCNSLVNLPQKREIRRAETIKADLQNYIITNRQLVRFYVMFTFKYNRLMINIILLQPYYFTYCIYAFRYNKYVIFCLCGDRNIWKIFLSTNA